MEVTGSSTSILVFFTTAYRTPLPISFLEPQVIAEYLQKLDPKSDGAKRDWVAIYDECASVLYQVMISGIASFLCYLSLLN